MSKDEKNSSQPTENLSEQLRAHQAGEDDGQSFSWMSGTSTNDDAATTSVPTAASAGANTGENPTVALPRGEATESPRRSALGKDSMRAPATLPKGAADHVSTDTSMLSIRPDDEDVKRRMDRRAASAEAPTTGPRIWQVIVAICFPLVLLAGAVRLIATPYFSWIEYFRPGFPADTYGFSAQDRLDYGSYTVDFLNNLAGSRFLGGLKDANGTELFKPTEVSHMSDVKLVYGIGMLIGLALLIVGIIGVIYLAKRSAGGVRRALFAGSIVALVIIIALAVFAGLGWDTFFTDFHKVLFPQGDWTFQLSDTLIRLYPEQFWVDGGLTIGILVLVVSGLVFAFTWPTRRRRDRSEAVAEVRASARAEALQR